MRLVYLHLSTLAVFLALDFVWLSTMTSRLYRPELGALVSPEPKLGAAALFYVLFVVGLLYFAVVPAARSGVALHALRDGALYGFFTYLTYEMTSYAVIAGWSRLVVVADLAWGTVLGGLSALAGFWIARRFGLV
ncbi:DUF2177 family protein [Methylobrevis pamukkalensis]|uniref:DUF2177 domain-containing protein n=1 Tax=Methylobrevis pamukkalensis TaxID=1439726 RepID=A0A1E3H8U0_9HYPH|nr:DUF2177 family protein [Methylobrevis pamukkalensis]ODN72555.1 hypothetical protein A6302_00046 [Methylobrevis pamukkalensis]